MKAIATFALGALAFWAPDILVHALAGTAFGGVAVLLLIPLLPTTTVFVFLRLDPLGRATLRGWPRALLMLLGIWVLGPLFMMISATFGGAGFFTFTGAADWAALARMTLVFWASTFMMATYDGALGPLLLSTLLLPSVAWRRGTKKAAPRGSEHAA